MKLCLRGAAGACSKCGATQASLHAPMLRAGVYCLRCCPVCARTAAEPAASKPGIVAAVAAKVAQAVSRWQKDHSVDPWYSDSERREAINRSRRRSWIPDRPDWFRRDQQRHVSAAIIGPDGSMRQVQAPEYTPRSFTPGEDNR